jgi:hypothetical protein
MTTDNLKNCEPPEEPTYKKDLKETWVLMSKREGDRVAGWKIDSLYEDSMRRLESSERCKVTSFCYPRGAKVVKAKLAPIED